MNATKLIFVLCILMIGLCGCYQKESTTIAAEVLIVNSEIIEGKSIGQFLGSSSGWIKSDVIKVGVKFEIDGVVFLEDLKLSHAQLAYYKDRDTLPLSVAVIFGDGWSFSTIEIRLCGYHVKRRNIDDDLAKNLTNYLRNKNSHGIKS